MPIGIPKRGIGERFFSGFFSLSASVSGISGAGSVTVRVSVFSSLVTFPFTSSYWMVILILFSSLLAAAPLSIASTLPLSPDLILPR